MRLFVRRVVAPEAHRENATKWQVVVDDKGREYTFDPECLTMAGAWRFMRDESNAGAPTVWVEPCADAFWSLTVRNTFGVLAYWHGNA